MNQASRARKRSLRYTFMSVLTFLGVATSVLGATPLVANAAAGSDTCTWTGGGSDSNLSTAANWSNCSGGAPVSGDTLSLQANAKSTPTITNDVTGLSFAGINVIADSNSGTTGSIGYVEITGQAFTITGDINLGGNLLLSATMTIGNNIKINTTAGELTGYNTNSLIVINSPYTLTDNAYTWIPLQGSGNLVIGSGQFQLQPGATTQFGGNITVANGSALLFCAFNGATLPANITVGGNGISGGGALYDGPNCGMGGPSSSLNPVASIVLSGSVTLTANTTVGGEGDLKITGSLSGPYSISMSSGQVGTLTIASSNNTSGTNNGNASSSASTVNYNDNTPTSQVYVPANTIAVVNGKYGSAQVYGGIIKGNGTVESLMLANNATVSPGQSPGTLTILNYLDISAGSTYQAEILNKDNYDQLQVGANYTGSGNAVSIDGSTLNVVLLSGYKLNAGDKFTIINNLSNTPVLGTFANMPEGATFTVGNVLFKISYVGGDGNDVVLTALLSPGAPNTGVRVLTLANPLVAAGAGVLAIGALVIAVRTRR